MTGAIEFLIEIDENGADLRRVDWLTGRLKDRLGSEAGCSAAYARKPVTREGGKTRVEVLPGVLAITAATTASVRAAAVLLKAWVERDRYKHMALVHTRTGQRVDVSGPAATKIQTVLESWRDAASAAEPGRRTA